MKCGLRQNAGVGGGGLRAEMVGIRMRSENRVRGVKCGLR